MCFAHSFMFSTEHTGILYFSVFHDVETRPYDSILGDGIWWKLDTSLPYLAPELSQEILKAIPLFFFPTAWVDFEKQFQILEKVQRKSPNKFF